MIYFQTVETTTNTAVSSTNEPSHDSDNDNNGWDDNDDNWGSLEETSSAQKVSYHSRTSMVIF